MDHQLEKLKKEVAGWPHVSVRPHRFGGTEFRFGTAEIGHVHIGDIVDIPFTRSIRDTLLAEGLAEQHHWVPNSGWVTFHMHGDQDLQRALWLMRLSYLRYALKEGHDPRRQFEQERDELHLGPRLGSLLAQFIPRATTAPSDRPLSV
jgi:hypothetical protein